MKENRFIMTLGDRKIEMWLHRPQTIASGSGMVFGYKKTKNFLKIIGVDEPTLVLDVGANVGIYAVAYAMAWPKAKILAIEPIPGNLELLRKNTAPFPNIEILPVAASDKAGTVTMQMPTPEQLPVHLGIDERTDFDIMSIHGLSGRYKQEVECVTLDEIVGSDPVGLLKIDVEAHEYYVLKGADSILNNQRPGVFLEVVPENQKMSGHSMEELFLLMASYRYAYMTSSHINQLFRPA